MVKFLEEERKCRLSVIKDLVSYRERKGGREERRGRGREEEKREGEEERRRGGGGGGNFNNLTYLIVTIRLINILPLQEI